MTREEAIKNLRCVKDWNDRLADETIDMAIEALEQEPCEDAISRNQVIKELDELEQSTGMIDAEKARLGICLLPSVQPTPQFYPPCEDCNNKMDEIRKAYDKCKDQELYEDDCISRKDTLEAIIKRLGISSEKYLLQAERVIYQQILEMPSVQPKQKIGHWKGFTHSAYHGVDEYGEPIWYPVTVYHCDRCNRRTVIKDNYCPNCGAKMEEEDEKA